MPSGNYVLIFVTDDGAGLNIEKIRRNAVERGLVTDDKCRTLDDSQVSQFIWLPGFSTADRLTEMSGRGVGMDAVRTRIRDLNGSVEVSSIAGQGTTFIIRLPLSLTLVQGFVFRACDNHYAIPLEHVREVLPLPRLGEATKNTQSTLEYHGESIPLASMNEIFGASPEVPDKNAIAATCDSATPAVVIVSTLTKKIGLIADRVIGTQKVVLKPLAAGLQMSDTLAGATILSDASVCLILDAIACVNKVHEHRGNDSHAKQEVEQ